MTPSLDQAIHAATHEKWLSYWKRCRIQSIWHKFPDYSDEYNPLWIRWREIPEGEDVTVKHPEIEIQQMETPLNTECYRALMKSLPKGSDWGTKEAIDKATQYYHENQLKKEKEFEEFVEYKKNGNLKIETIDETKPISWESIRDASTEELFQTKLEIFESPPVQESENKEYRSNIRNSASIIEAMYCYYLIVNDIKESLVGTTINPDQIVILFTGWTSSKSGDPDYYTGGPYLSNEAANFLVEQNTKAVAIDFPIDKHPPTPKSTIKDFPVHRILLGAEIPIIENLINLHLLVGKEFTLSALPLKLKGGDGSATRAVAFINSKF